MILRDYVPPVRAAALYSIPTPAELTAATERVLERLDDHLGPLAAAYEAVLTSAGSRMARSFKAQATELTAAAFVPPDEDEVINAERLAEEVAELAGEATREAARVVVAALDDEGISYDIETVFTDELLERIAVNQAFAIEEQLRETYRFTLRVAGDHGFSVADTAEALRNKVADLAPHTARAIARTELNGLANGGSVHVASQVFKGTDKQVYKSWLATEDERTRDTHIDAHGQSVPVNDYFDVGGAKLAYPGDPFGPAEEVINCRCTVIYGDSPTERGVITDAEQEPDPLFNVRPNDDLLEAANHDWQSWVEGEYQVDLETHKRRVEESLVQQLSEGNTSLRIRTPNDVALKVIEDGRFKSQFESQQSRGMFAPAVRRGQEELLFSYPEVHPDNERPIYGYVGGVTREDGPVQTYGDVVWQLKSAMRARTTWTANDSLGGRHAPSPINRPSALSFNPRGGHGPGIDPLATSLVEYGEFDSFYVEAQYHGGVTLDDVERVIVYYVDPGYEGTGMAADTWRRQAQATADELRAALAGRGIEVEVRAFPRSGLDASGGGGHRIGQLEHGLGIDAGEVVSPVPTSGDAEGGHLRPEVAGRGVDHAHLGRGEAVPATADQEHVGDLTLPSDDLHTPNGTSDGGGSHPTGGIRYAPMLALPTAALARALPTAELVRLEEGMVPAYHLDVFAPQASPEQLALMSMLAARATDLSGLAAGLEALAAAVATPQAPPVVHVHVPEQLAAAPVVHVQVPDAPAPVIQLADGPAPVVNVTVDVPAAEPVINVELPEPPLRTIEFERDSQGRIVQAEEVA